MTEHTVRAYGDELEILSTSLVKMGGVTEKQLADSIESVSKRDLSLAEKTIANDQEIDVLEQNIEEQVVRMLALRQPMGSDLRLVLGVFKISSDLERIGDLSKNVAKRALVLNREPPVRLTRSLSRMGLQSLNQLRLVLNAYTELNCELALTVWRSDEEVDELYNSLFRELLTYMMEDPRTIGLCTHLLFMAKNYERIGDHATNIAETVHYMVTGSYISVERPKSDITSSTKIDFEES